MNGAEQAALAALPLPWRVLRPVRQGAAIVGWDDVPAAAVLGALMQRGWRIEAYGATSTAPVPQRPARVLHLVQPARLDGDAIGSDE